MNKKFLKVALFAALLNVSLTYSSCSKEDDSPAQSKQEVNGGTTDKPSDNKTDDVVLVSELKCTVAEFATKYTTLKKGEKVNVTLTDVSDANISKLAQTLQKMSATKISKAASDDNYIVVLVLESKDELTKIPAEVFKDCKAIVSVTIPECVELIENGAFEGCTALETVKILNEVAVIQEGAFAENVKVEGGTQTEVVVKPEIKLLSPADIVDYVNACDEEIVTLNMALETYDHTDVMFEIEKITDKKVKLVIPEGVEELGLDYDKLSIGEWGLYVYPNPNVLSDVVIPKSVTSIGSGAFSDCSSLTSITIPNGVTSIGGSAFSGCSSLTSITIPDGVTKIGSWTFQRCSSLTNVVIPNSVTEIGQEVFSDCSSLASITIPKGVTWIRYQVFKGCSSLANIIIPGSVTDIDNGAFIGCSGLARIVIPNSVTIINPEAFKGCSSLTSITIPDGVTKIFYEAFKGCSSLTSITIPDGVTEIGEDAFSGCSSLETIYCSQAIYNMYHKQYPQMRVEGVDNSYTQITFQKQYGAMNFTPEDDYESVVFEFEEIPSDVQITFTSDLFEKEESWGNSYYAAYYPVQYYINGNTIELNLDQVFGTEFADLENGRGERANKITSIAIQNNAEGENVVYLKSVTFVKRDGTSVVLKNSEEGFDFEMKVIE